MSEYKSHRIKTTNVPKAKSICTVGNKDMATLAVFWAVAAISFLVYKSALFATPFVVYGIFIMLKPYKGFFDGYNSFFVIYDQKNKEECDLIYLSELKYWSQEGTFLSPRIKFFLADGQKVVLEKAVDSHIAEYLRKVAPKKEIKKKK